MAFQNLLLEDTAVLVQQVLAFHAILGTRITNNHTDETNEMATLRGKAPSMITASAPVNAKLASPVVTTFC
jgi:hypothetical protein